MVINREFFFRGWLPAGLLINARLITVPSLDGEPVFRPLLNPSPETSWPVKQPPIVFPVSQATDSKAILLKDPISEGAIVMLPLDAWYGPGTPCILATNVWYEGRIQEVSGGDVMAVRLTGAFAINYYSYYSGLETPDVRLNAMPCKFISGVVRDCRAFKDPSSVLSEMGYIPTTKVDNNDVSLPILDMKKIGTVDLAGMRLAFASQSPSAETHFIQCEHVAGKMAPSPGTKFFGLIGSINPYVQNFYTVSGDSVSAKLTGAGFIKSQQLGVLSTGAIDDQVVHYN